jgi:hypothetical protein
MDFRNFFSEFCEAYRETETIIDNDEFIITLLYCIIMNKLLCNKQ